MLGSSWGGIEDISKVYAPRDLGIDSYFKRSVFSAADTEDGERAGSGLSAWAGCCNRWESGEEVVRKKTKK